MVEWLLPAPESRSSNLVYPSTNCTTKNRKDEIKEEEEAGNGSSSKKLLVEGCRVIKMKLIPRPLKVPTGRIFTSIGGLNHDDDNAKANPIVE